MQPNTNRHLRRTSPRCQKRVEDHIPRDRHGIREVSVNLVEDIFGGSAEEDRACFGRFAFCEECKVSMVGVDRRQP